MAVLMGMAFSTLAAEVAISVPALAAFGSSAPDLDEQMVPRSRQGLPAIFTPAC